MLENGIMGLIVSWLNSMIEGLTEAFGGGFFNLINPMTIERIYEKYAISVQIAYKIGLVAFLYALVTIMLSFDLKEIAKAKRLIVEVILLGLFLRTSTEIFGFIHGFFNALSQDWGGVSSSSITIAQIMTMMGVSMAATGIVAATLNLAVVGLIAIVLIIIILIVIANSVLTSVLGILSIIMPLLMSAALIDKFKPMFGKLMSMYCGLCFLMPIMKMTLALCASTFLDNGNMFNNALQMIGMLIAVLIVVPCAVLYIIASAGTVIKVD